MLFGISKHIDINEKRSTHRRTFYDCAGFVSLSRVLYYNILFAVLLSSLFFFLFIFSSTVHRKYTVFFLSCFRTPVTVCINGVCLDFIVIVVYAYIYMYTYSTVSLSLVYVCFHMFGMSLNNFVLPLIGLSNPECSELIVK